MSMLNEIKRRAAQGNLKYTWEDLQKLRADDEAKQWAHFKRQQDEHKESQIIGRSGVMPLHANCTVENFQANTPEKIEVKEFSAQYIREFSLNNGTGFIFSGTTGTGKNHLASAICNELISQGKSCLIITVTELMQKLRRCYDRENSTSEDDFIQSMVDYDLLVIDEIGLQRGTNAESLTLNQIVDLRTCRFKPTGMLTNLGKHHLMDCLGERIMDRMRMNGGTWKSFEWESFRR